jgi:hypothetical protein
MGEAKEHYLTYFIPLFYLAIASFFTWWGGWSYGPRYLIVLAILLVYEGLLFISKYKISRAVFLAVTGYGLVGAWLTKSTLAYMVPDHFLRNERFSNTLTSIILPEALAGRYNSNNIMSMLFHIGPGISSIAWLTCFLGATLGFALWYQTIVPGSKEAKLVLRKKRTAKNKKKRQ